MLGKWTLIISMNVFTVMCILYGIQCKTRKCLPDWLTVPQNYHTVKERNDVFERNCAFASNKWTDWSLLVCCSCIIKNRTYVDDGIGLNIIHIRVSQAQLFSSSLRGAHDPRGNCVLKGKWAADGNHEFSWSEVSRSPEQKYWKLILSEKTFSCYGGNVVFIQVLIYKTQISKPFTILMLGKFIKEL